MREGESGYFSHAGGVGVNIISYLSIANIFMDEMSFKFGCL